jgi:hypothetical protein
MSFVKGDVVKVEWDAGYAVLRIEKKNAVSIRMMEHNVYWSSARGQKIRDVASEETYECLMLGEYNKKNRIKTTKRTHSLWDFSYFIVRKLSEKEVQAVMVDVMLSDC